MAGGYVDVDDLHMYYEVHGEGSPVVLLHGGMLTVPRRAELLLPMLDRFLPGEELPR